MEKVITGDGTWTFYSEKFQEIYHSKSGAIEEAEKKHVASAKNYLKDGANVLDFCFGLGYNSIVALHENPKINVIALEDDLEIIQQLENLDLGKYEKEKQLFIDLIKTEPKKEKSYLLYEKNNLKLYLGDARLTMGEVSNINVCFFDPFSRKHCPELWTEDIFKKVYAAMNKNSILTTYSCARPVRDAMKLAGFEVNDGPVIGRRAPATIALK